MLRQVSGNATKKVIQTTPERMLRNPKFHLQPSFSKSTPPRMGPMLSPAFGLEKMLAKNEGKHDFEVALTNPARMTETYLPLSCGGAMSAITPVPRVNIAG